MLILNDDEVTLISRELGFMQYFASRFLNASLEKPHDYFSTSELQQKIHDGCENIRKMIKVSPYKYNL